MSGKIVTLTPADLAALAGGCRGTKRAKFDNPFAYIYPAKNDQAGDITILFKRPRKNGGSKDSSAVIPRRLLKKIIAGLQTIDRELSGSEHA